MEKTKTYFIRFQESYDNLPEATNALQKASDTTLLAGLHLGYYLPQPVYKSWVPNWIIRLITKR